MNRGSKNIDAYAAIIAALLWDGYGERKRCSSKKAEVMEALNLLDPDYSSYLSESALSRILREAQDFMPDVKTKDEEQG